MFLVLIGLRAGYEGYWTMKQVERQAKRIAPYAKKKACLSQHGGYYGAYALAVGTSAVLVNYSSQWHALTVVTTGFVWAAVVALGPLRKWTEDTENDKLIEALARFGLVSIPGTMNAKYAVFVLSILTLYFGFTSNVSPEEVAWTTGGLMVFVGFGVLLPSWVTYRRITPSAAGFAILLWAGTIGLGAYRLYG